MATLAVGMADDLNNILTTVMAACALIEKGDPANGELLQYVALIRTSAERAVALSDRLMRAGIRDQEKLHSGSNSPDSGSCPSSARDKQAIHDIISNINLPDGASA